MRTRATSNTGPHRETGPRGQPGIAGSAKKGLPQSGQRGPILGFEIPQATLTCLQDPGLHRHRCLSAVSRRPFPASGIFPARDFQEALRQPGLAPPSAAPPIGGEDHFPANHSPEHLTPPLNSRLRICDWPDWKSSRPSHLSKFCWPGAGRST